ncbi:MAG: Txe/YoeB family addiction module toxin [Bacteroidia bacterium]
MMICFTQKAFEDYQHLENYERKIYLRINELLKEISRNPFKGTGKPEPLKHNLKGWWSRRITDEHRLVYRIENDSIIILYCRFHYD